MNVATTLSNQRFSLGTTLSREAIDAVLTIGRPYLERVYRGGDWYLTAYKPIKNMSGEPIGHRNMKTFFEQVAAGKTPAEAEAAL